MRNGRRELRYLLPLFRGGGGGRVLHLGFNKTTAKDWLISNIFSLWSQPCGGALLPAAAHWRITEHGDEPAALRGLHPPVRSGPLCAGRPVGAAIAPAPGLLPPSGRGSVNRHHREISWTSAKIGESFVKTHLFIKFSWGFSFSLTIFSGPEREFLHFH